MFYTSGCSGQSSGLLLHCLTRPILAPKSDTYGDTEINANFDAMKMIFKTPNTKPYIKLVLALVNNVTFDINANDDAKMKMIFKNLIEFSLCQKRLWQVGHHWGEVRKVVNTASRPGHRVAKV